MTLFELQQWLGHSSPHSTQHYAKITPLKVAKSYADAGYFARNLRAIEVLVDQEVVRSARAASEPWKFYDLGHGYCTYDFFDQCPHRMACAKCDFYMPKQSTEALLLEGKTHLLRLLQEIPLGEAEQAAVEDGVAAYENLLSKLTDVPTPAGQRPVRLELVWCKSLLRDRHCPHRLQRRPQYGSVIILLRSVLAAIAGGVEMTSRDGSVHGILSFAIELTNDQDRAALQQKLSTLIQAHPTLRFEVNTLDNGLIVSGDDELDLMEIRSEIVPQYEARVGELTVSYKESIRRPADGKANIYGRRAVRATTAIAGSALSQMSRARATSSSTTSRAE